MFVWSILFFRSPDRLGIYLGPKISFQPFFVQAIKIVVDSWKIQYVIAINIMGWLTHFYDFRLKGTATVGIGIHPIKAWLSQLVNFKLQSGREDTLEERYAIKLCFKIGKTATETYGMLQTVLDNLAWIEHQLLSGIRDSMKAGSLWEMMRGVGGVRKSIHQNWLAKGLGLGLGLLCWGYNGFLEEIPSEEVSTLQIESVTFPPGQCTSPQLHPCHRLFDQDGNQDSSSPSL